MKLSTSILLLLALAGCGGGGGGSSPVAVTTPVQIDPNLTVPVQTAIANLVNKGITATFKISGTQDQSTPATPLPLTQITGSGTLTLAPGTSVVFTGGQLTGKNAIKQVSVIQATVTSNGQTASTSSTSTSYYSPSNYTKMLVESGNTSLYFNSYTNPSTVKAGDAGSLGTASTGGALATTYSEVYSVAKDSANSLLVTFRGATIFLAAGSEVAQTTYRVDTSGNAKLVSVVAQSLTGSQIYKNITYTFD